MGWLFCVLNAVREVRSEDGSNGKAEVWVLRKVVQRSKWQQMEDRRVVAEEVGARWARLPE